MTDDFGDPTDAREARAFAEAALSSQSWCHLRADNQAAETRFTFEDLGRVTRRVRGDRMRDRQGLYDEFAAAWQFGDYDGPSFGAFFRDSIQDLNYTWPTTTGFVIVISEADQLLVDEPETNIAWTPLKALVQLFDEAAENYSLEIPGPPDDITARPALSFDVVLVTDAEHRDQVRDLWRAAGAPLED